MATLQLTEILIEAAIAKLREGLPARIAAINTEHGPASGMTDIVLGVPSESDIYPFGIDGDPSRFPSFIVGQAPAGSDFSQEGAHSLVVSTQLVVAVVDADSDRQRLGYKLIRHERAIIETIWDDEPQERLANPDPNAGTEAAYSIVPEATRPGRALTHDENASLWLDMQVIYFRAYRVEE